MDEFDEKDDNISETSSDSEENTPKNNDEQNDDDIDIRNDDNDEEGEQNDDDEEGELNDDDNDEEDEELNKIRIKETIDNEIINEEIDMLENDEDLDEDYLQKIDTTFRENIIKDFHPELKVHNFEEIQTLCKVVRDEKGEIVDPLHKTLPFITCYEKTRVIGERAKQINKGAKHFVNIDPEITDGYLIALKEYEEKKIPFIIQRPLPNGQSEYWRFCDLECF